MTGKTPAFNTESLSRRNLLLAGTTLAATSSLAPSPLSWITAAQAQTPAKKPNILILWGDDIGFWNISTYNQGMMGYKTPNIDRIATEGGSFSIDQVMEHMERAGSGAGN